MVSIPFTDRLEQLGVTTSIGNGAAGQRLDNAVAESILVFLSTVMFLSPATVKRIDGHWGDSTASSSNVHHSYLGPFVFRTSKFAIR